MDEAFELICTIYKKRLQYISYSSQCAVWNKSFFLKQYVNNHLYSKLEHRQQQRKYNISLICYNFVQLVTRFDLTVHIVQLY